MSLIELARDAIPHSRTGTSNRDFASIDAAWPPDESVRVLLQTADARLAGCAFFDVDMRAEAHVGEVLGRETRGMIRALLPDMTDPAEIAPRVGI